MDGLLGRPGSAVSSGITLAPVNEASVLSSMLPNEIDSLFHPSGEAQGPSQGIRQGVETNLLVVLCDSQDYPTGSQALFFMHQATLPPTLRA